MQGISGGIFRQNLIIEGIFQNRAEKKKIVKKSRASGLRIGPQSVNGHLARNRIFRELIVYFLC